MQSTIYMNHYPHFSSGAGREAVTADLTASVAELSTRRSALGHAVDLTFKTLGFDIARAPSPSNMLVIGSQNSIEKNSRNLRVNIGTIAKKANDLSTNYGSGKSPYLPYTMDVIAQRVIPRALERDEFIESVGMILNTFGEECNDDGCGVAYGKRVGWYLEEEEKRRILSALPKKAFEKLNIPALKPNIPAKEAPLGTLILRRLSLEWAIDHASDIQDQGFTEQLHQEYTAECELNAEAIEKMNEYLTQQTGKEPENLYLPFDLVKDMVNAEKERLVWKRELEAPHPTESSKE